MYRSTRRDPLRWSRGNETALSAALSARVVSSATPKVSGPCAEKTPLVDDLGGRAGALSQDSGDVRNAGREHLKCTLVHPRFVPRSLKPNTD